MKYKILLQVLIIMFVFATFCYGFFIGGTYVKGKIKDYDIKEVHYMLNDVNFNYCPYCGEELKGKY